MSKRVKRRRLPRERLGEILLHAGSVSPDQIEKALDRQQLQPGRLGTHLLELGAVDEDALAKALSVQYRIPPYLLSLTPPDPATAPRVPRQMAHALRACPVSWDAERDALLVATANPDNLSGNDEIRFASGARRVLFQVAPDTVVERLLAAVYDGAELNSGSLEALEQPMAALHITSSPQPAPRQRSSRGRLLLADPDSKRGRALATLADIAGYRVTRVRREEELTQRSVEESWDALWLHADWADAVTTAGVHIYTEPYDLLEKGAAESGALAREALLLAEEAVAAAQPGALEPARQAAALVRFIASRRGLGDNDSDLLEVRTWRSLLHGGKLPGAPLPPAQQHILEAVAAYFHELQQGHSRHQAAAALRSREDLDASVVTTLLRWAVGADLLEQMDAQRSLAALFPTEQYPAALLNHFRQAGWQVDADGLEQRQTPVSAVLASVELGLELLEHPPEDTARPPVFLLAEDPSAPQTMYALRAGAEDVFGPDTHPELVEAKIERAVARSRPLQGQVTGTLRDMGLADMLQILSNGMRTATVHLEHGERSARVTLMEGQICDARSGDLVGEEALYSLIGWDDGSFRIDPQAAPCEPSVQGSTEGLLMEGFRRLDEARRQKSATPPPTARSD